MYGPGVWACPLLLSAPIPLTMRGGDVKTMQGGDELEKLRKNGIVMDTFQYGKKRETIAIEDGSEPSFCAFGVTPV